MEEKEIIVKVINKDNDYYYKGNSIINKDIIKFVDNETTYIFDKTIERLIKTSKEDKTVIDFNNKELTIIVDKKELKMPIIIKCKQICGNNILYKYVIDNNIIEFEIKEV
jgi:hypothetical protein